MLRIWGMGGLKKPFAIVLTSQGSKKSFILVYMYKYCMNVKKRPLPEITHFFLTIVAQLRNCSIVHFILETDMAKKCRSWKLQFDSIFCILHCSFCISLELLSFHSFKVWKVLGLGFNTANQSSFHFPKSLFGDIVMISLIYLGKIQIVLEN